MSTTALSVSAASHPLPSRLVPLRSAAALVAEANIGMTDRVLVMGRNVIEQVVALAQTGCRSLLSLRAESAYPRDEPVDVLWLSKVADLRDRLGAVLSGDSIPRIIVVEAAEAESDSRLRSVVRQLRAEGFVRFTLHRTHLGIALVAVRPTWLQQVI